MNNSQYTAVINKLIKITKEKLLNWYSCGSFPLEMYSANIALDVIAKIPALKSIEISLIISQSISGDSYYELHFMKPKKESIVLHGDEFNELFKDLENTILNIDYSKSVEDHLLQLIG